MEGPGYLAVAIQPGAETNDADFHEWYNTEHGPLRMRLPFILTGDRYTQADGRRPEWIAVYDVSDLSWLDKRIYTRLREERSKREQKVMGTFESLDRKIYKLLSTRGHVSEAAPVQLAVSTRLLETEIGDFTVWSEENIEKLTRTPGWLRSRQFRLLVGGIQGLPPTDQIEVLTVHEFEGKDAATLDRLSKVAFDKTISDERRTWQHHLTFDKLEEPHDSVITTDGAVLKFQLQGPFFAPIVVFVNSILTNLHIWDDVTQELINGVRGKSYRVLRYNSRGYSKQDPKSNPTRFDLLADDLEYLLQRLNIDKVHAVVGVSMGGVTAINFSIKHPDMLDRFIACDCNVAASPANNSAWEQRIELARSQGMDGLAKATAKRWFTPENHGSANAAKTMRMAADASFEGFVENTGALCNYDLREQLHSIRTPGLLIAGEGDGKLPEAMQNFGIPNTRFVAIPSAGHLPMLENHDAFMEALLQGLEKLQ